MRAMTSVPPPAGKPTITWAGFLIACANARGTKLVAGASSPAVEAASKWRRVSMAVSVVAAGDLCAFKLTCLDTCTNRLRHPHPSFARRQHGAQPIGRSRQFRERGLTRLRREPSDQARDGERASKLTGEVEDGDRDGGHLRVALAQRYVISALLHRLCLRAFGIGEGEQHMGAGAGFERQLGALIEVVPRRLR